MGEIVACVPDDAVLTTETSAVREALEAFAGRQPRVAEVGEGALGRRGDVRTVRGSEIVVVSVFERRVRRRAEGALGVGVER